MHPALERIRSDCNWYFGQETVETRSIAIRAPLSRSSETRSAGNLDFSYQDGHVAAWLHDNSPPGSARPPRRSYACPDVIASYHTSTAQDDYRLFGTNPMRATSAAGS